MAFSSFPLKLGADSFALLHQIEQGKLSKL
jgi:hypothetical protein